MNPNTVAIVATGASIALTPFWTDVYHAARRWIRRSHGEELPAALEEADRRALATLLAVAKRLGDAPQSAGSTEASADVRSFDPSDPDHTATLRSALLSAARTADPGRHQLLAQLVAERVRSSPETTKAVASVQAVEVLHQLADEHLAVLGLLAFTYAVRPAFVHPTALEEGPGDDDRRSSERYIAWRAASAQHYSEWARVRLAKHSLPRSIGASVAAHLAATSCVIIERGASRKLPDVLVTKSLEDPNERGFSVHHAIDTAMEMGTEMTALARAWKNGMQELVPTPAGLLIGLCVHDELTRDRAAEAYEWSRHNELPAVEDRASVWKNDHLTERVLKDIGSELLKAARGYGSPLADAVFQIRHGRR